jgi:hypothetical protein
MRRAFPLRILAVSLAFCLLTLSAAVYPQVAAHTAHHAHHQAASHGTVLCTWICAAGQAVDVMAVVIDRGGTPTATLADAPHRLILELPSATYSPRGPPN